MNDFAVIHLHLRHNVPQCNTIQTTNQQCTGFGWDGIFVPTGETEPFSCMDIERKCQLSHRSKAVVQWADWLGNNVDELWERQMGRPAIGHKGLDFKPNSIEQ